MQKLLILRRRPLQTILFFLIIFTFYVYYRTTLSDVHLFGLTRNNSHLSHRERTKPRLTLDLVDIQPVASKWINNITQEPSSISLGLSVPHSSVNNVSDAITKLSASTSLQSVSSMNNKTINAKLTSVKQVQSIEKVIKNNTLGSAPKVLDHSVRALYRMGHSVSASKKCPNNGSEMDLVIIIMSAPNNSKSRDAIRKTWGHYDHQENISILFMLGETLNVEIKKLVHEEKKLYNDIICGNFIDSYWNLTLKTISALEWVDKYCFHVKFVLKTDDDMFINVPRLQGLIKKHRKDGNVIFGRLAKKWKPIRTVKSKYYVSHAIFPSLVYPDFMTGPAYLLSRDTISKLFNAALNFTYLQLEDVFVTGIVASKLNIKRVDIHEFANRRLLLKQCNLQNFISIHMVQYHEQYDIWKKLYDGKSHCS